jgi:hypothetical protein
MQSAIHFVSQVTAKILSQLGDGTIELDTALELFDTMQTYGFVEQHTQFFDAVKTLAVQIKG